MAFPFLSYAVGPTSKDLVFRAYSKQSKPHDAGKICSQLSDLSAERYIIDNGPDFKNLFIFLGQQKIRGGVITVNEHIKDLR